MKVSQGWQWLLRKCNVSLNLSVSFDNVFLLILFLTYTVIPNILNKDVGIVNALSLSDFQLWCSSFCASNEEQFCTLIKMHFPSNRALPDFFWVIWRWKLSLNSSCSRAMIYVVSLVSIHMSFSGSDLYYCCNNSVDSSSLEITN